MSFGPGSLGPPTAEQVRRWDLIRARGCIVCVMHELIVPAEIHHLTVGGKHGAPRLGHDFTIGLCCWHHRGEKWSNSTSDDMDDYLGPSYAKTPRAFRHEFGSDQYLLRCQNLLIGWPQQQIPERRIRRGSTDKPVRQQRSKRGSRTQRPEKRVPRPGGWRA